jgi:Zn-dependent protease
VAVDWGHATLIFAAVVPSIILHEVAHGAVANHFGDDTAKRAGRLTLNPVAHVDPFGTLLLPALLSLSGFGAFGYAKPVPVNVHRLRNPRRDTLLVSLAGPAVNIALAVAAGLVLRSRYAGALRSVFFIDQLPIVPRFLFWLGLMNALLAAFNLLPIPPLDGSALVERSLPREWWPAWLKLRQYGMGVLLLLLLVVPSLLQRILQPAQDLWLRLL